MRVSPDPDSTPSAILLIEDSSDDADLVEAYLRRGRVSFGIRRASSLAEAVAILAAERIDLILLDIFLPDARGLDSLSAILRQSPGIPVVLLTGVEDEDLARQALRMGAQDYIAKTDLGAALLSRTILYALERSETERRLRRANEDLEAIVAERTKELKRTEEQLRAQSAALAQKNAALNELLAHLKKEKDDTRQRIEANIRSVVLPVLDELRRDAPQEQLPYFALLETAMRDLAGSFSLHLERMHPNLTRKEAQICALIRGGMQSKEIARLLSLSPQTVERHRANIRKKLGLTRNHASLYAYLCRTSSPEIHDGG